MAKSPKKPLKVSKLNSNTPEPVVENTPAPEPKPEAIKTPDVKPVAKPAAGPVQKTISPLLSEPIEVKEHAMGIGPGSGSAQPQPQQSLDGLKVDDDFFATKPVNPPLTKNDLSEVNKNAPTGPGQENMPPQMPPLKMDVPEQQFNPNPGAEPIAIPDNVSRQAASELCDTILSMYKRLVPEGAHEYTKLNTKEIKKLEASGDLLAGSFEMVATENKENKSKLEKRAADDAVMIKKPLAKLLEVKNINAPPHIELLIILVFVGFTYFMMVRGIKKSNDELLSKLYEKINRDRAGTGEVKKDPDSDVPLAQTETVIK